MITPLELIAAPHIRHALGLLGRTEDIRFAPSGKRLAIAGFAKDELTILDVEAGDGAVHLTGMVQIWSTSLHEPHGVSFLDDDTLVIANRHAEVPIFHLPASSPGLRRVDLDPVQTLRANDSHGLKSPGSVVTARLAPDLYEIIVCNNYADNVSRHLVDARDGYRVLSSEVLAQWGLEIPDGAAISADREWLAISNHNTHSVFVHRFTEHLGPDTGPYGVLENVNYPHGLCFTADGSHLLVADAGAPYVHVFARGLDDWRGIRQPVSVIKVMDDQQYLDGRYNTQEGGPKGIDIDRSMRLVAVSSEHQPLDFFAASDFVPMIETITGPPAAAALESTRVALLRALQAAAAAGTHAAEWENATADRETRIAELHDSIAASETRIAELTALCQQAESRLTATTEVAAVDRAAFDATISAERVDRLNAESSAE